MLPILLELGPFTIYSLWLAVILGLMAGTLLFLKRAKYERMDLLFILDHLLSLMIGTILCSRLVFFLINWGFFGPLTFGTLVKQVLFFWQPGYSFWGGVLGFSLVFLLHSRRKKEDPAPWLNVAIVPFFMGIMIGNIGQLLDGQGYGKETILPWGITFESTNVKYTVPVHPTQIYSILLIAAILFSHKKITEKWPQLKEETTWTLFAITVFSFGRFLLEFLRGDDTAQWGPVRLGHIVSLLAFVFFGHLLYRKNTREKRVTS